MDIFALTDSEMSHTSTVQMEIDTGDHPQISRKPYLTHFAGRSDREDSENMLRDGNISHIISEWSSHVVLVTKKNGTHRLFLLSPMCSQCCDALSVLSVARNEDILSTIDKARFFSNLSARCGFLLRSFDGKCHLVLKMHLLGLSYGSGIARLWEFRTNLH